MADSNVQNLQSGPGGPGRTKVGHGPLWEGNSLHCKDDKKWTANSREKEAKKDKQNLLKEYLRSEKIKGSSIKTIQAYSARLKRYYEYLDKRDLCLGQVRVKDAQSFQAWLTTCKREGVSRYKRNTIRSTMTSASRFCAFLKNKGILQANPFKEVKLIKKEKSIPRNLLKESEMMKFLETLEKWENEEHLGAAKKLYKVHIVSELLYSTGMRIGEAAGLKVQDIDFERSMIRIRKGKGDRRRVVFLNEYAGGVLKLYITEMRELFMRKNNKPDDERVFRASMDRLDDIVNEVIGTKAGICGYESFTSHAFRHCFGYHLLKAGCDIRYIQALLGHEKLGTTEIYTKVDKEDLREVLDRYHPRRLKRKR